MPFEKTAENLSQLINRVIREDPQIRASLEEVGYEGKEIYEEIAMDSESLWEVASAEIRHYDTSEQECEALRGKIVGELGAPPSEDDPKTGLATDWIAALLGLYSLGLMIWGSVKLIKNWRQALASLSTLDGWLYVGAALLPMFGLLGLEILAETMQGRRQKARRVQVETQAAEWEERAKEARSKYGLESLESRLEAQRESIEKLLLERVKRAIVAAINHRLAPSYVPLLEIKRPRGFGEVFDQRLTIQTRARERLQFMLNSMPGGSIGIAGSRGAGKTTLLKLFCGPKRVIDILNDKPVLGVLVSAPVAYEARDFILYLFSAVCQNVIEAEGGQYKFTGVPADTPPVPPADGPPWVALRPLPSLLIRIGTLLILASLLMALGLASLQPSTPRAAAPRMSPGAKPRAGAVAPKAEGGGAQSSPERAGKPQEAQKQDLEIQRPPEAPSRDSFAWRWVEQLKIDPATFLAWGIVLTVSGLMLAEFLRLGAWRTFLLSLAWLLEATLGSIPPFKRLTRRFLDSQRMKAREEFERRRFVPGREPQGDGLRVRAETWLKAIKFQQSFTSGWSGSLKLPIGLEGGVNRAVTLAQNQLSLPEVVYFLARFLEEISLTRQVIIGIDEMDKLASDELAQKFLNDIKSIFGLERCFYLISVSENAMSSFERRGLPFRDVFDSAFDDYVYVDYLNFESAMKLLEQRVVGRPIPFFGLSYCMSGGLARDLIRNFRGVLGAMDADSGQNTLSIIAKKIVTADLLAKTRATLTSAKKINLEFEVDLFIEVLYKVEASVDSDDLLVETAGQLLAAAVPQRGLPQTGVAGSAPSGDPLRGVPPAAVEGKDHESNAAELRELSEELGTYIYYAVTLRQVFNDGIQEQTLTQPPAGGHLDNLAKARQVLGVNPAITRALLKSFRNAHGLVAFP